MSTARTKKNLDAGVDGSALTLHDNSSPIGTHVFIFRTAIDVARLRPHGKSLLAEIVEP